MCIWKGVIKFFLKWRDSFVFFNLITPTLSSTYTVKNNVVGNYVTLSRLNMSKAGYNFISQKI